MKSIFKAILPLTVTVIAFTPAFATTQAEIEKRYTQEFNYCTNNGDVAQGIQPAMNACAAEEYTRQDSELNQAYVMVMKPLKSAGKTKLRNSQRAWIKSRDKTCKAERAEYEGGTIAPLIFYSCLTNETIMRTLWLEKFR